MLSRAFFFYFIYLTTFSCDAGGRIKPAKFHFSWYKFSYSNYNVDIPQIII